MGFDTIWFLLVPWFSSLWGFAISYLHGFLGGFFPLWRENKGDILCVQSLFLLLTSDNWKYQIWDMFFPPSPTLTTLPTYISAALNNQCMFKVPITASTRLTLTQNCFYSWALSSSSPLHSSARPPARTTLRLCLFINNVAQLFFTYVK